ncbi:MAG: hypothetical protein QM682_11440 [Paracoccus sp. (in: a-proteobacteria)]|uniref:hypothetical protein n=1 Tax=Paracoccus sp. TaxID=267 RepID=UPI0039E71880
MSQAPRRLLVHVGLPKTGSTSFHHYIKRNAQVLAKDLVIPNELIGIPMRPIGRAAIAYSLSPDAPREADLRGAFADLLAALPDNGLPVLLTHENLAGAMPGNGGETRLFPMLPRIAAILTEMAPGFDPHFAYYSRPMPAWRESVWAQAVRTDGYCRTLPEFLAETAALETGPDAGWDALTARLAARIGADRVTRLPLEEERDPLRPGHALLRLAGLAPGMLAALAPLEQPAMARLNAGALEFLRQVNAAPLNPHARDKVVRLVARCQPLFNADFRPQGNLS